MKHYLSSIVLLFLATVMLCGCATAEERAARAALQAAKVKTALSEKHYLINVDRMYPLSGAPRHLTFGYSIEVRNDSLISYLPYMGRAYSVPYGGGKALNFEAPLKNYKEVEGSRNLRRIYVQVYNDEDIYTYMFEVFANGKSTVHVDSRNRQPISFDGDVVTEENKK